MIQESSVLLNRLGIILNFIAGFLIAPELIGEERLKHFEIWMKERLHRINKLTDIKRYTQGQSIKNVKLKEVQTVFSTSPAIKAQFEAMDKAKKNRAKLYYLTLIGLWLLLWQIVEYQAHKFIFVLSAIGIFFVIGLIHHYLEVSQYEWLAISLIEFLMNFLGFVVYPLFFIIFFLLSISIRTVMYLFYQPTRLAIHILQGRDRLKSIVVSLGIILFILGNLFQFIATFGK